MSAFVKLRCDGCGNGYEWPKTSGRVTSWAALRKILRDMHGWHVRRSTGQLARDLCADCWKAGER
jgi:hypothetical protein